jgi:formylmethanofuran dehydrogenase subunit E
MSADNWRVCPQCLNNYNNQMSKSKRELAESYEKISADQFMEKSLAITDKEKIGYDEETLMEYYEIQMDEDGEFSVDYSCHCDKCGFHFDYSDTKIVAINKQKKAK